ncbi:MAG: alpha-galactosidase, partial [Bacteroidetes bacterium]|nr:alpha-galactosidase [Bacteroidota bacterium]
MNYPGVQSRMRVWAIFFCVALLTNKAGAQQVVLETGSNALVLAADTAGHLHMGYLGKKLKDKREYARLAGLYRQGTDYTGTLDAAYTTAGTTNLAEPAITVVHADGNRSLDLRYLSHKLEHIDSNVSLLTIELKDPVYALRVMLFYKVYFAEDIIEQWSAVVHREKGNILLEKFASANLYLRAGSFYLTQ